MQRNQYFIECLQANKFRELKWINSILAITNLRTMEDVSVDDVDPYELLKGVNEHYWFFDPVSREFVDIEDAQGDVPLFYRKDLITIPAGTINILPSQGSIDTTIGNALANAIIFFYPFGKRIPYFNGGKGGQIGKMDPGAISKMVTALLLDDKEAAGKDPESYISVKQLQTWMQAVGWLAGLASIVTAGTTEKSIRVAPEVLKRRDELYEEFKDQLGNPAIQSRIEVELVNMDKESLKNDPSYDYYYKHDKHWATSRKKQLITTGLVSSISGDPVFIAKPLTEGIDAEDIPTYSDSIRHASYSRGHLTALGGELVKYIFRVTQNIKIVEPDCGTKFGISDNILSGSESMYIGRYVIDGNQLIEITNDNVKTFLGKNLFLRSPAYCKTGHGNFCEICMGKDLSRTPKAIHTAAAEPGSVMMNASMKAMHGKASKTVRFDFRTAIT